ncbi:hypothetical protein IGI04_020496 [Brassica rapa subsp. trilocularis]|uniref:Uncharacterized protein n=1 Tax=Brassica rapa subsp. trilocularis TaxID=1813537 RepID=A0ABQ7MJ69_BRACM|nr:hypothetical protein IGI04_020496 [Brassica rapa subsp. trilocularis]
MDSPAVLKIDNSLQSWFKGLPILFLVVETIVQECELARFTSYYVIAASSSHYDVSNFNSFSQSQLSDPLTGATIIFFYRGFRTSCSQNPINRFFNVNFDFFIFFQT